MPPPPPPPGGIPEIVEDLGGVAHHRPDRRDIEVTEVGVGGHVEVVIADVAPAQNGQGVVGDHHLIVHPVIDAPEIAEQIQHPEAAVGEGVEEPYLDLRVLVQGGDDGITAPKVYVVQEQANAKASIGCLQQSIGENPPALVGLPDIVLEIQALLRELGHGDARGKGVAAPRDQRQA